MAWLSLVLYPVGRVVTYLSMGMLKLLGLKGRRYTLFPFRTLLLALTLDGLIMYNWNYLCLDPL